MGKTFNIKAERLKLKKRKLADNPVGIASPRSQMVRNQDQASARALQDATREKHLKSDAEAEAERRKRLRDEQHAAALCMETLEDDDDVPSPSLSSARTQVGAQVRRLRCDVPRVSSLPRAEFVEPVTLDYLQEKFGQEVPLNFEDVCKFVKAKREVAVLCALNDGNGVRTWNSCVPTMQDDSDSVQLWSCPAHWKLLVDEWASGSSAWLTGFGHPGNYNNVLRVSDEAVYADAARWPPQLCSRQQCVIRMTRTDAFSDKDALNRSMSLSSLVAEMALTLHMASVGIGPEVYAAVSWPWDVQPGSTKQRYGLLMVLQRAEGDMLDYEVDLDNQFQPETMVSAPRRELRESAESAGEWLASLCFQFSLMNFINFDIKPANLLMRSERNTFFMTDFDKLYTQFVPDDVAGMKARLFVNLLLLCTHVRAFLSRTFATSFTRPLAAAMMHLWEEAVNKPDEFGAGGDWLKAAVLATTKNIGEFNDRELNRIANHGERMARMLTMMTYEYLFNTQPPRQQPLKVQRWPRWDKSNDFFSPPPLLVPQLLNFAIFYDRPVPCEFAELLRSRARFPVLCR